MQGCSRAAPDPSSWGQAAGAPSPLFSSLGQPALISGVEWGSPWGRSRVSSLAFAPSAEKQVRMQRTRVSEQLPKLRNQAVSKAEEGRRGAGRGEAVKGAVSVGDAPPRAGERGEWGTSKRVGCP